MRPDPPVQAHLHGALGGAGGVQHRPALADRVPGRLLDEDVRARLQRRDGDQRVPVVRGGNDDDFGFFLVEQLAEVLVLVRLVAGFVLDVLGGGLQDISIHVAQSDHFGLACRDGFVEDVVAPPAATDQGGAILSPCGGAQDGGSGQAGHGGGQESTAGQGHLVLPLLRRCFCSW
jgi:hypothetical protein